MRLFVASFLSPSTSAAYAEIIERVTTRSQGLLRLIPPASAHVTLAFLGDVERDTADQVIRVVTNVASVHAAISIQIGPPHIMPGGRAPRLTSADLVVGREPVVALARDIATALRRQPALAALPDPKPPHVTLARFRRGATQADARRIRAWLSTTPTPGGEDRIAAVHVVQSELTATGPQYRSCGAANLGGDV